MTLTPLAPMQGPQPQGVPSLPNVPAPMQPQAAPVVQPWHQDVVANFQQAHATFDPLAVGLATGAIPVAPTPYMGAPVRSDSGGGGAQEQNTDQQTQPTLKEGSPFSQYNQGQDMGPQTASPAPAEDSQPAVARLGGPTQPAVTPLSAQPGSYQYDPVQSGETGPGALVPFTNQNSNTSNNPLDYVPVSRGGNMPDEATPPVFQYEPGVIDNGGGE